MTHDFYDLEGLLNDQERAKLKEVRGLPGP